LYLKSDAEIVDIFTTTLEKMFPGWDRSSIKASHVSRAEFAQPVVTLGYSEVKPEYASPYKNLYTASMAHIYPEDRGQNYAIRSGLEAADLIISNTDKHSKEE
jgi:protoporphyrinogen oxidase